MLCLAIRTFPFSIQRLCTAIVMSWSAYSPHLRKINHTRVWRVQIMPAWYLSYKIVSEFLREVMAYAFSTMYSSIQFASRDSRPFQWSHKDWFVSLCVCWIQLKHDGTILLSQIAWSTWMAYVVLANCLKVLFMEYFDDVCLREEGSSSKQKQQHQSVSNFWSAPVVQKYVGENKKRSKDWSRCSS